MDTGPLILRPGNLGAWSREGLTWPGLTPTPLPLSPQPLTTQKAVCGHLLCGGHPAVKLGRASGVGGAWPLLPLVPGDEPGLTRTCLPHRTLGGCSASRSSQCPGAWLGSPAALKTGGRIKAPRCTGQVLPQRQKVPGLSPTAPPEGPKLRRANADGHGLIWSKHHL